MADTVTLNAGAGGAVIATDDAGAAGQVQIIKLAIAADGSATIIPADATVGLRVDPAGVSVADGGALPSKGLQIGGTDGSVFQVLSTDNAGRPNVNINGAVDTELPAAAALADGAANPTSPAVGAFALLWNGSTWDRAPGGATNGLTANLKALNGTTIDTNSGAKSAGTQRVILASDQTVVPVSDNSGSLTVDAPVGTPAFVRLSDGAAAITALPVTDNAGSLTVDNGGTFAVQIAANSSVNNAQVSGTATSVNSGAKDAGTQRVILASDQTVVPISDNAGSLTVDAPLATPVFTTVTPSATGGWSKIKYAAQTTTVVKPKGTAGTFGGYYAYNPNASVAYIQVFDLATATTVTLGTTVPDMIFGIPAASAANLEITNGVNMALGMQLACTTTATGSTAPGTGLDLTVLFK